MFVKITTVGEKFGKFILKDDRSKIILIFQVKFQSFKKNFKVPISKLFNIKFSSHEKISGIFFQKLKFSPKYKKMIYIIFFNVINLNIFMV